jgi:hypothetical protein
MILIFMVLHTEEECHCVLQDLGLLAIAPRKRGTWEIEGLGDTFLTFSNFGGRKASILNDERHRASLGAYRTQRLGQ